MERQDHIHTVLPYQGEVPRPRSALPAAILLFFWSVVQQFLALGAGLLVLVAAFSFYDATRSHFWLDALWLLLVMLVLAKLSIKCCSSGIATLKAGVRFLRGEIWLSDSAQHTIRACEALAYTLAAFAALIGIAIFNSFAGLLLALPVFLTGVLLTITRKLMESAIAFAASASPPLPSESPASPAPAPPPPA